MKINKLTILSTGICSLFAHNLYAQEVVDNEPSAAGNIERITVSGNSASYLKSTTNSGALGSKPVLDTPFSIATISDEEIETRQVNSLDTLFSRDASVSSTGGTYSGWGSNISVRGLPLDYTESFKINGLSANNFSGELPYEAFQQIELLKGATGFMYGFAAPGGVVNYVTKRPVDHYLSTDAGFRSDAIYSEHVDASTLFGSEDKFGIRLNVAHEEGDIYDGGKLKRDMASLAFDARITDDLLWTTDVIYNERNVDGSSSWMYTSLLTSSDALPKATNGDANVAFNGSFNHHRNLIAQTALKWDINNNWNSKLEYAYTKNDTRWMKTLPYLLNSMGDLRYRYYDQYFDVDYQQLQLSLQGKFATGIFKHEIVSGVSWQKNTTYRNDPNRDVSWLDGVYNLYDNVRPVHESTLQESLTAMWDNIQKSLFINDSVSFQDDWTLLLGARVNRFEYNVLADIYKDSLDNYEDTKVSPTAALLYKPESDTTFYISYVESFEKGSTVGEEYANANELLPPLESKQYEIGVKVDREKWSLTTALFRLERGANIITADNYYLQDGITLYQGWEVGGKWLASDNFTLLANLMLLNAEYDKTDAGSAVEGNNVAAAPEQQASVQASYDVSALPGLTLNAGAKYYGKMALDAANTWELPGYTLFDAAVSYSTQVMGQAVTLRCAASNLTDKAYWTAADNTGGLRIGEPRVVSLNLKVDF